MPIPTVRPSPSALRRLPLAVLIGVPSVLGLGAGAVGAAIVAFGSRVESVTVAGLSRGGNVDGSTD